MGIDRRKKTVFQILARIGARRRIDPVSGCWEYTGHRDKDGYGIIKVGSGSTRLKIGIHRLVASLVSDLLVIGDPRFACHRCDNPPCFNPAHLFIGTNSDNQQDSLKKGRRHPLRGDRSPNAKLTTTKVEELLERRRRGETLAGLAKAFGIHEMHCFRICRGLAWKHIPREIRRAG